MSKAGADAMYESAARIARCAKAKLITKTITAKEARIFAYELLSAAEEVRPSEDA
mgnify:CR=1 FL=1